MFRSMATKSRSVLQTRFISNTSRALEKSSEKPTGGAPAASKPLPPTGVNLTDFDKKVLVWTKKYKSIDDIPPIVGPETLDRARNNFRIKVCNYMVIGTVLGCILMIYSGKKAAERGESVVKSNQDWHKQYNEAAAAKENKEKTK